MLIGRADELARIDRLLGGARSGTAGVLAVVGPPGQGKTVLLDRAQQMAEGFLVLHAAGSAAERTIGLAGLGALLRPLLPAVRRLPDRQRRALEAAFALADPPPGEPDPLALGSGVLALITAPSPPLPVLLVVDDIQWWDDESRRVLDFAARRLGADQVAVLLAARTAAQLPAAAGELVTLHPFEPVEAEHLLLSVHDDLSPAALDALVRHGGGNPLALVEAARGLPHDLRRGVAPLGDSLSLPAGLRDAYAGRLTELPVATQDLLLLAACDGRGDVGALAAAGADLRAVGPAEEAGLVAVTGGRLRFRHPLVVTAVLEAAGTDARSAAHRALAAALAGQDRERSVWHRAGASSGPDDRLADELSDIAAGSRAAGAWESAARADERAAELVTGSPAGHLVRAAASWLRAGRADRAARLVGPGEHAGGVSAAALGAAPRTRAAVAALAGRWAESAVLRLSAADGLSGDDRVAVLLAALPDALDGQVPAVVDDVVAALAAERPSAALQPGVSAAVAAARLLASVDPSDLGRAPEVVAAMQHTVESADQTLPPAVLKVFVSVALSAGHLSAARVLARRLADAARSTGDVSVLAASLATTVFCDHSLGRWNVAYASATEVRMLVTESSAPAVLSLVLHLSADIDAARGRVEACRAACAELRAIADRTDDPKLTGLADRREGMLHLATGDPESAVRWLESAQHALGLAGESHPYFSPAPELVEGYLRLGRSDEAHRTAADFSSRVGPGAPPTARARVLRLAGLLVPDGDAADALFEESEALDTATGLSYFLARTLLLHGERLRRDRRRADARNRLARAAGIFRQLEASPWTERAEAELAACGANIARSSTAAPSALLTPQELQIGLLVKQGLRNRDIAATLFLSLRTVEAHLSSAYRKLGVSGRTQLAALLVD